MSMHRTDVRHVWSVDANVKPHLMFCHIYFHLQFYKKQIVIFMCFRWYYLFSGVEGCLELPITQLKLQRYDVVLHFLMSKINIVIICLLQSL